MINHNILFNELLECIQKKELHSATISSPRNTSDDPVIKVTIRPIHIKKIFFYQVSDHYKQKVLHKNISSTECSLLISKELTNHYRQGIFHTVSADYHLLINHKKELKVIKKPATQETKALFHNRKKKHIVQSDVAAPFLIELGIMTPGGQVIAKKYDKFKQINRFMEIIRDIIEYLPSDKTLEIIDFGCGKASLTFALYHYLSFVEKRSVNITGLDLKRDVIEHCQALADKLKFSSLKFCVGDINHHEVKGKVDCVISLHACDTATDAALEKAVNWDADVILCVPCCQHELYNQVESQAFMPLLRHGILKERFAALVTDAARAELLTTVGYECQVLEFIDMEHTPKNLMIRAIKKPSSLKQQHAKTRYDLFKETLNITPMLETKLKFLDEIAKR